MSTGGVGMPRVRCDIRLRKRVRVHYLAAPPHIRRQMNQGFFTRLLIAKDGSVERYELTEPFASLLHGTPGLSAASHAPETGMPEDDWRARPQAVLRSIITESDTKRTSGDVSVTAGSNNTYLVEPPASAFQPRPTSSTSAEYV